MEIGTGRGKTFLNLLCGENASLKFFFLVISILLLGEELYNFFILKPTLNRKVKTHFTKDDFPIFTVCPDPAYDMDEMNELGYYHLYSYKTGQDWDGTISSIKGWDAKQTDSVMNVSRKISLLKSVQDCPDIGVVFYKPREEDHDDEGHEYLQFELTRAMFPYHLCCRVKIPKAAKKYPMTGIEISFKNKTYDSITLLVNDRESHSIFNQHNSKALGDNLQSPSRKGLNNYKLKIHREISLESDPQSNCYDYPEAGDYDKCLEAEIIKQMNNFVNCTPPWMTENENVWCGKEHATDLKNIDPRYYLEFMNDLISGQFDHGKCSAPCRKYSYHSTGLGFVDNPEDSGVTIFFDKIIDDTIFDFKIDSITLLTRFGGIIGVTKNLLWIVLLFITITSYFLSSPSGRVKEELPRTAEGVYSVHSNDDQICVNSESTKRNIASEV